MRKYIIIPFLTIMVLAAFTSCKKDFLEVVPQGNQVAVTTSDYDMLMNDPKFYITSFGGWQEPMLMGDEVAAEGTWFTSRASPNMIRLFQWQDSIYIVGDFIPGFLSTALTNMYTLNKIINEVMGSSDGTETQKNSILAEAMANRAWMNFQFINFYGKPYLASTAATDPGFPLITQAEVSVSNYTRATVQAVYDAIIKDLQAAIPNLPLQPVIATRMSRPAAEGILGKVYLFMGRHTDALPMFNAAFTDLAQTGFVKLTDYNQAFAAGGSYLPIDPTSGPTAPEKNSNDLSESILSKIWENTLNNYPLSSYGVVITQEAAALYLPSDLRLKFYKATNPDGSESQNDRLRKYGVTFSRWGLQLSELYLLSAECKARTGDLAGATADVQTLRKNRMPAADAVVPAATAGDATSLIKYIIDERTREFAAEGYRWFDMRRLSVDPLFQGHSITHTLHNDDGTTTIYTLNQPNRLTLKLPPMITTAYPDMPNNP